MDRAASGGTQAGPAPPDRDAPIDSEEDFKLKLAELEQYCDEETGECRDKLENFKKSIADHKTFMKEAIGASPDAKWKVVMWHYSIYSAGMHATDDAIRAVRHYMVPVLDDLPPASQSRPEIVFFSANVLSAQRGETITLSWETRGAAAVWIEYWDIGNHPLVPSGCITVDATFDDLPLSGSLPVTIPAACPRIRAG